MAEMISGVVLIGDVVGSRRAPDRQALHDELVRLLNSANQVFAPVGPIRITLGDEFQGAFASAGEAIYCAYWLRAVAAPETDVRFGIGCGEYQTLARHIPIEDGPAYWLAREAIVLAKKASQSAATRHSRVAALPDPGLLSPILMCLDGIVGAMTPRSLFVLYGLLSGRSQKDIASDLQISPSAVSQRIRADNILIVVRVLEMLRRQFAGREQARSSGPAAI